MVIASLFGMAIAVGITSLHQVEAQSTAVTAGIVTASEFRLVDRAGHERGAFEVRDDGTVLLTVVDPRQQGLVELGMTADGVPRLSLQETGDGPRVTIDVEHGPDRAAGLEIRDEHRMQRLLLGLISDSVPVLTMRDRQQRSLVHLGTTAAERPQLAFQDGQRSRAIIGLLEDGTPAINMWDADGELIWDAPPEPGP